VDVTQWSQDLPIVLIVDVDAEEVLLLVVPRAAEHPFEAHRRVPVQSVHDRWQVVGIIWVQQVLIAPDAKTLELEREPPPSPTNGIHQQVAAFPANQIGTPTVAAGGDMETGMLRYFPHSS